MANLDSSIPFKISGGGTLALEDGGANSITVTFIQAEITWTETGRQWVEGRSRDRHEAVPVALEVGDSNVEGSFQFLVTSWRGAANVHPYEALSFTGNASAWTTTAAGSKKALKATYTTDSTADGGGSQTVIFAYMIPTDLEKGDVDGLLSLTGNFTDLENRPTMA